MNYPGYFLRHSNYDFQLARNGGTPRFAADATFRQVAGLADSSWSSFQSYNYPDRYIRHYAYQLRPDPITTTTGRGDATFRMNEPSRRRRAPGKGARGHRLRSRP
ncbi:AbfB domain-containing protein [Streptomyces sp. UG1]|uniref:AbfB domain-containing protein n=1 Tax=Streptomyces sp. UG1 TaxID=3417652 RepID=UPI003CEEFB10